MYHIFILYIFRYLFSVLYSLDNSRFMQDDVKLNGSDQIASYDTYAALVSWSLIRK